jgi:hypothetical protein
LTLDHERALMAIAGGALIILILWLLSRGQPITNVDQINRTNQILPNIETGPTVDGSYSFGPINLGSINLTAPQPQTGGCGCGCSQPSQQYEDAIEATANTYSAGLNALLDDTVAAYKATLPPTVSQYFNNFQNNQLASQSMADFLNPYG